MVFLVHAALFTLFLWWFTTGAIIYLDGLPRRTFGWSLAVAAAVAALALAGLSETANDTSVAGAYWAFTFALLVWGFNEMSFLMGAVTGPRNTACPAGAQGLARLGYAIQAVAYHEIAIALSAFAVLIATDGGTNQVGLNTFALLWVMRLSAKVNVYLGVPNITEEFLPPHLKYLQTYFRRRPMNWMLPVSITGATVLSVVLAQVALSPTAGAYEGTAYSLLATLAALALLEHWFMVLPFEATALWKWGLVSHATHAVPLAQPVTTRWATGNEPGCIVAVDAAEPNIVPFPVHTSATLRRRP